MPDLITTPSQLTACTRISTLAQTLDDKSGLFAYVGATTLETVAVHPDLRNQLALIEPTGWRAFKDLYMEADRRRGKPEAQEGTNVHALVEALINDREVPWMPDDVKRDADAALAALQKLGLTPVATEEFVYTPGLPEPVAGTRDILAKEDGGVHVVVDLKTSTDLKSSKYKGVPWSIQLASYARGIPYRMPFDRDHYDRPLLDLGEVDFLDSRLVDIHHAWVIEVGRGMGKAKAHFIDIDLGWQLAELACRVREARRFNPIKR